MVIPVFSFATDTEILSFKNWLLYKFFFFQFLFNTQNIKDIM